VRSGLVVRQVDGLQADILGSQDLGPLPQCLGAGP
jgi:hypothetical protein